MLIECELQCRKREVTVDGSVVAVKECGKTFGADNGAESIGCGKIVSPGGEEGVMRAALELQARFEDFGGDIED